MQEQSYNAPTLQNYCRAINKIVEEQKNLPKPLKKKNTFCIVQPTLPQNNAVQYYHNWGLKLWKLFVASHGTLPVPPAELSEDIVVRYLQMAKENNINSDIDYLSLKGSVYPIAALLGLVDEAIQPKA